MTNAIAVKPLIICALILIVSGFAGARAQTSNYWTGEGSDNSWTNPLNWSTNQVPGAEDSVIIDVPASLFYRIHIDGEHSVRDLTISSNRAVLAIEGSFSVLRNFTFSEGRIEGSGVLIVESDMDWINGDMYGDGTTILSGNTLFRAPGGWTGGNILDERTLEIRGHLRIDEGTLWPHNGAVVIVDNSATVEMTDGDTGIQPRYGNVVKPRLINRGVIAKTGGSSTRSTIGYNSGPSSDRRMVLENYGEIRNEAGNMSIYFAEESINEGTLIAEAGSIDLFHAGGLHADPIIVAGTLRGSAQFQLRYALHLAGDVDVSGVMIVRDGQEFTSDLTISRLGYLVIDTNQFTEYVFTYAASGEPVVGGLQVDGRLHLESDLTIGGHAGIGMRLPAEVTGDGNLTVLPGGNLRWGYGSAEGAGTIHVQGDFTSIPALLQIGDFPEQVSATHLIGSTLIFDGDVTWDDGNLVLDEGATVVINDNANFDVHRDGQFVQGEFAIGSERIINLGTFQKSGVGRRTSQGMDETTYDDVSYGTLIDVEFENSGTLSAQEGEIIIGGQFVQMGLIEGTSTLDFSNGSLQFLDGRIAPGPDIGTLTLVGNFELYDQLIEIDVSSDGNDMLIVEGNVALGGNLAVVGQDLEASPGDRFVIAEATGFLAGDFDEVFVENMGNLDASISIADNQVIVELTGEAGSPTLVDTVVVPAVGAAFRADVYYIVGAFYYVCVVLYYDDAVPLFYQRIEGSQQFFDVVKMQAGGGFVEYKEDLIFGSSLAQERCQFHPLRLAATQRIAALAKLYIAQPHII